MIESEKITSLLQAAHTHSSDSEAVIKTLKELSEGKKSFTPSQMLSYFGELSEYIGIMNSGITAMTELICQLNDELQEKSA